jgi:heavy metal translocating P-type ATPase
VMIVAVSSFCLWGLEGNWEHGFQAALAVLVVACPCALGIATPMATTIALSRAIGRGCLVRSGAVLETLSRVRTVAFDKTGTVTAGRPMVGEFRCAPAAPLSPAETLRLAAGLEQEVSHPFARAIVAFVLSRGAALPAAADVRVTSGSGAQGIVNGHRVAVGKLSWLTRCDVPSAASEPISAVETGSSAIAIAIDGRLAGQLLLDDPPRPEARAAMTELHRMGVSCHLVSGDRRAVVARIAGMIGCEDTASDQSPTDKPVTVRALRTGQGLVAMVGDGVNDAPALGAADAGIAFGPAADLARETADVAILREDLLEVPRLLALARATFRIVRQNLAWAFAYNSVAVLIAAFGLLRPVFAAAAMVLSSVCVVANSMRLVK